MALYELCREIFNQCSGNQMRDVFIEEVEVSSPDEGMARFMSGGGLSCKKSAVNDALTIYDVEQGGVKQRYSWTKI